MPPEELVEDQGTQEEEPQEEASEFDFSGDESDGGASEEGSEPAQKKQQHKPGGYNNDPGFRKNYAMMKETQRENERHLNAMASFAKNNPEGFVEAYKDVYPEKNLKAFMKQVGAEFKDAPTEKPPVDEHFNKINEKLTKMEERQVANEANNKKLQDEKNAAQGKKRFDDTFAEQVGKSKNGKYLAKGNELGDYLRMSVEGTIQDELMYRWKNPQTYDQNTPYEQRIAEIYPLAEKKVLMEWEKLMRSHSNLSKELRGQTDTGQINTNKLEPNPNTNGGDENKPKKFTDLSDMIDSKADKLVKEFNAQRAANAQ